MLSVGYSPNHSVAPTTEKAGTIKPLDTQEQKESHIDRLRAGRYKHGGHVKR